jgi:hypothetical protein
LAKIDHLLGRRLKYRKKKNQIVAAFLSVLASGVFSYQEGCICFESGAGIKKIELHIMKSTFLEPGLCPML